MTTLMLAQILRDAKARIADPHCWVKGVMYGDINGREVPSPKEAVCFCAAGAVAASSLAGIDKPFEVWRGPAVGALFNSLPFGTYRGFLSDYSDDPATTHADIMALFDRAIQRAEADNNDTPATPA